MTNMRPTKQDRITSVLRKIRAYQNKPIVVAPGDAAESVLLHPIEAILLANHITHLEDTIASLENLVSEQENDVGVYKRKVMRFEGQVLALRSAAQEFVDKVDRGEARSKRSYAAFKQALTDTAQAGRESEARIVETARDSIDITAIGANQFGFGFSQACNRWSEELTHYANRLRNGGSEGE